MDRVRLILGRLNDEFGRRVLIETQDPFYFIWLHK
jgi:hypothetical protein